MKILYNSMMRHRSYRKSQNKSKTKTERSSKIELRFSKLNVNFPALFLERISTNKIATVLDEECESHKAGAGDRIAAAIHRYSDTTGYYQVMAFGRAGNVERSEQFTAWLTHLPS